MFYYAVLTTVLLQCLPVALSSRVETLTTQERPGPFCPESSTVKSSCCPGPSVTK